MLVTVVGNRLKTSYIALLALLRMRAIASSQRGYTVHRPYRGLHMQKKTGLWGCICWGRQKMPELTCNTCQLNKKLSYCWETVRRESIPTRGFQVPVVEESRLGTVPRRPSSVWTIYKSGWQCMRVRWAARRSQCRHPQQTLPATRA